MNDGSPRGSSPHGDGSQGADRSIESYRAKRDFEKTPEPAGRLRRMRRPPRFVIHRHEARRLHYDLRIEMGGVLKSWAVPKGFSFNPADKRLAVRTEDHPMEYEHFEGVIPEGHYGAGTMTIWDRGRYELLGETAAGGLDAGKLELRFFGYRLRGEWHMVRMKKQKDQWLLFKSRDRYARGAGDPVFALDLSSSAPRPMPRSVRKMQTGRIVAPFEDHDWLFELKLSGFRVLVGKRQDRVSFRGAGQRFGRRLDTVVRDLRLLRAETALLDGVLVCVDEAGRPSRELLERVLAGELEYPVEFYVFDLLYYEDWDLRAFPLLERKAALSSVLPKSERLIYVAHERSRGAELIESIAAAGLPGCIAKRAGSTYVGGASEDWVEVRLPRSTSAGGRKTRRSSVSNRRHRVRLTNREKVLWPQEAYTKGELIDYYDQVADVMLPYLQERPLSMHRFPDGIEGESFFQKNAPPQLPAWVATVTVQSRHRRDETTRFVLCNDRHTLLYLANLACIELHPWSSRRASLESADWTILDLDPSTDDYAPVVRIARAAGKLLRSIGLRPYIKTSGSRGLHIYVPLTPGYSYDQARLFAEGVARYLAHRHSAIATVERAKPRRRGRVYLDFLQNRRGQTVVAPYSVRPRPGAPVSTPLDWDEVTTELPPSRFTIQSIPARLARCHDLFRGVLDDPQDLLPAIDALRQLAH